MGVVRVSLWFSYFFRYGFCGFRQVFVWFPCGFHGFREVYFVGFRMGFLLLSYGLLKFSFCFLHGFP